MFLHECNSHGKALPNELRNTKQTSKSDRVVCLDSSFIPLELSRYLEDDGIVNMTMGMVKKELSWYNLQLSEALHHLQSLQLHFQKQYYKNDIINK